ncbi:hypothetical protein OTU49_014878, partial [Cherax quadricarinatus]
PLGPWHSLLGRVARVPTEGTPLHTHTHTGRYFGAASQQPTIPPAGAHTLQLECVSETRHPERFHQVRCSGGGRGSPTMGSGAPGGHAHLQERRNPYAHTRPQNV